MYQKLTAIGVSQALEGVLVTCVGGEMYRSIPI